MVNRRPGAQAMRTAGLAALLVVQACGAGGEADDADDGGAQDGADGSQDDDPFWFALSEAGWLEARMQHTAVWSGTEMIVWGGVLGSFPSAPTFGDGGRYDPVSDTWQPITAEGAPSPRAGHTAVWTGEEMIVWGGSAYEVDRSTGSTIYSPKDFNDGGRYDPLTDSWRPLSLVGAPFPRYWHQALWTGSEMIVWGGFTVAQGTGIANDGAIYDPATDSWRPIDTFFLPREIYSSNEAVWTGRQLLVVATSYSFSVPYVVARYDPATGLWSLASMTGAPDVIGERVAWTGSELILWGQQTELGSSAGGRYDPVSDSWKSMAQVGAPSGRRSHTILWADSRALVWGGITSSGEETLKTGAAYDPVADAWEQLPRPVDDIGREAHTAIWSGRDMIVWGGRKGTGPGGQEYLKSGTRYRPQEPATATR